MKNHHHALAALLAVGLLIAGCGDDVGGEGETGVGSTNTEDGKTGGNIDDDTGMNTDTAGTSSGGDDAGSTDGSTSTSGGDATGDGGGGTTSSGGSDGGGADGGDAADGGDLNCPGGAGCKCEQNSDCDTAYCLDFPGGKKCAQLCTDTCPQGLACKDISGGKGDTVFACVSELVALCAPCMDDQLCQQNGVKGLCLD